MEANQLTSGCNERNALMPRALARIEDVDHIAMPQVPVGGDTQLDFSPLEIAKRYVQFLQ